MKKIIKISFAGILGLFVIVCIIFAAILNIRYPAPEEKSFRVGDIFEFYDYEIQVTDYETSDLNTFCNNHDLNNPLVNITEKENIRCCMVTIKVKNISDKPVTPELYQIIFGSKNYSNGLDVDIFRAFNNDSTVSFMPTIEPGEYVELSLPYTFYGTLLGYSEGDPFDDIQFELTLSLYPTKYTVKLNNT